MRVALCLPGQLRQWKDCFPSIKKAFMDSLEPDVFISTWYYTGGVFPKGLGGVADDGPITEALEAYRPVKFLAERWDQNVTWRFARPYYHLGNSQFSMFYKWKSVIELKKQYEAEQGFQYDVVIRIRPDVRCEEPIIPLSPGHAFDLTHKDATGKLDTNRICVPEWREHPPCHLKDLLMMGASGAMDSVCSIYDSIDEIWAKSEILRTLFSPERLLLKHVEQLGLELVTWHCPVSLRGFVSNPNLPYHLEGVGHRTKIECPLS
jgi:hypothetical protein